ncbi:SCO1 protein [Athelia psychrophila]|uniref:SCO1 protein n=1 Tax=Athelia psychrophila TaxID=1759441 RepID=A0A167VSW1_9AGAM|nr:SCO1 protein [Fibularhizoctonia sp. CBS 109695]
MLSSLRCQKSALRALQAANTANLASRHLSRPATNAPRPSAGNKGTAWRGYTSFPSNSSGKDRAAVGVFTPKAAALFIGAGVGLYFYFRYEKEQLLEKRRACIPVPPYLTRLAAPCSVFCAERETRTVGRAQVGGPFTLRTHKGTPFSELDLLGKWNLVYFGFTNCPDICPAELDKIGGVIDELEKEHGRLFQPLFVSVDPARDSLPQMAAYLADFHPRLAGLVGDWAATKAVCRAYRVYFSTPPDADPAGDYLVDHSIFVYLMDPRGAFVEAFGQSATQEEVVARVGREIGEWERIEGKTV